ncbi:DUF4955 domain-containing protein [Wenyingzhuangia sp. IMCC45467]
MKPTFIFFKTLLFCSVLLQAQEQDCNIWENYKTAKQNNTEAILPDFSYAGYQYSEVEIPKMDYKIFDVTQFGAKPNDTKSDKTAILKAVNAATKNGKGVVFFPKGKYYINTKKDELNSIIIKSSNIIFRGEDEKETILFFDKDLPPTDPKKLWTCPYAIETQAGGADRFLTNIIANSQRETYSITVKNSDKIKKEDWVILKVLNNNPDLITYDLQPLKPAPEWTSILNKGVQVNERHKVKSVNGNTITFYEPIHYDIQAKHNWKLYSFAHINEIGFENIHFEGNWKKDFVHHRSAQDDGGWSILKINRAVNSWIKNCTFSNVNNAAGFSQSAACTALNITIKGNIGHGAVHAEGGSTGILLAKINDLAGMHHAAGVGGGSTTGTVVWRSKHPAHTSFESHASQPRCTLFDNVEGGFFLGRAGGAKQNLPNHGRYLVLWNYNETDEAETNFEFWSTKTWYWKIVPPIIVGFHGSGTTFKEDEIQVLESLGTPVKPTSLFESQLALRLGKLPKWIEQINNN